MAHIRKNNVQNYTSTSGTGSYAVGSAVSGYSGIAAAMSNADTACFTIRGQDSVGAVAWETILGTYTSSGSTVARTTVLSSSTGSAINWGSSNKTITIVDPAERTFALNAAGTGMVGLPTDLTLTGLTGTLLLPGTFGTDNIKAASTSGVAIKNNSGSAIATLGGSGGTGALFNGSVTVTGAATFNGAVTLGDATGDDITVTGRLASGLTFKTDNANDIGASGANRPRSVYLGTSVLTPLVSTTSGGLSFGTSASSSTLTLNTAPSALDLVANGSATDVSLRFFGKNAGRFEFWTGNPSTALQVTVNHTASAAVQLSLTGAASGGNPTIGATSGAVAFSAPIRLAAYTVATLPTAQAGRLAYVTDANATTFYSVVSGGGANVVPVFSDGTNWRIA